ncbi:serine/threonine protein kinase [Phragmitibacter flavus]|uniref:non-specific serine/threonine protein kinase n=1 Tax=Phragmitibacter flavus TaxID=2576071 RepID=A0A5R8KD72_9BACT|nr:serine/threonine-protein kinase [Phragmitibacter flavus]TLD70262.1 serine/threonine protein kinase [Phragmitibacter flavus]
MAGRYRILEQLGAGGVGAVFKAYDTQLNRYVAVKRLLSREEIEAHEDRTDTLVKEAGSLAALQHPNIVSVYDLATDEEGFFIVMELLEGETLADWIHTSGVLTLPDFYELATQTLEAVLTAHHQSILHRDLKPENLKVLRLPGGRLQVKVLDFGLARLSYGARKMTEDQSGNIFGSIYYMAPEQLQRLPVDGRTDLYALGCMFYQSLSGYRPFEHQDIQSVIQLHLQHLVHPLRTVAPHVPQPICDWVMWLFNLDPAHRPASAQQALDTLREIHKAGWFKVSESVPMAIPVAVAVSSNPNRPTGSQRLVRGPGSSQRLSGQPTGALNRRPPTASVPGARPASGPIQKTKPKKDAEETTQLPFWIWPAGAAVLAIIIWSLWPKGDDKPTTAPAVATAPVASSAPIPPAATLATRPPDLIFPDNIVHLRAGENMIAPGNKTPIQNNDTVQTWNDTTKKDLSFTAQGSPPRYLFDKPEGLNHRIGFLRLQPGNLLLHRMARDKSAYKTYPMAPGTKRQGLTAIIVARPDPTAQEINLLQIGDQDNLASLTVKAYPSGEFRAIAQVGKDRKEAKITGRKVKIYSILSVVWDATTNKLSFNIRSQDGGKTLGSGDAPPKPPIFNDIRLPAAAAEANYNGDIAELIVWPYAMESEQRNVQDWRLSQHYFTNPGTRY